MMEFHASECKMIATWFREKFVFPVKKRAEMKQCQRKRGHWWKACLSSLKQRGCVNVHVGEEILNEEKGIAPYYHVETPVKHLRSEETGRNLCTAHIIRNRISVFLVPRSKNAESTHHIFYPLLYLQGRLYHSGVKFNHLSPTRERW